MNAEIYQITYQQLIEYIDQPVIKEADIIFALSREIILGLYDDKPVCFIGLVPSSFTSDTAYCWIHMTEYGQKHPLLMARYAKEFLARAFTKYNKIWGYCEIEKSKVWLKRLGAVFVNETTFEIRGNNG